MSLTVSLAVSLAVPAGKPDGTPEHDDTGAATAGGAPTRPAIVVTGASEGIGLAIAHRFAATGHAVLMIARREDLLEAAARDLGRHRNVEAIALALDVTAADAGARIEAALALHGLHADILVNNAGIGLGGDFLHHGEAEIISLINLNVLALSLLTRRFLPAMIARRSGGIINVASVGGFAPGPYQAAYYASKAYVISLTRALAQEVCGQGVGVCVVTPGPIATAFHAKMGADTAFYRYLLPALGAEAVARATWRGWHLGFRVIQPGLLTPILTLLMRLTPWLVLVPIVGFLLHKRYPGGPRPKP